MASTSMYTQIAGEGSLVNGLIMSIVEKLSHCEREKIDEWVPLIEEHAENLMLGLRKKTKSKRRPEILAAAAVYDAFLEYESRTQVRCTLPMMKKVTGLTPCSINTAWTQLFDGRFELSCEDLNQVYLPHNSSCYEAVDAVLKRIMKAILNRTKESEVYINDLRNQAYELLEKMDKKKADEYDPLLVGTAVIYAAIYSFHGKPKIRISQRILSYFYNSSPSMISKAWLKLFAS